MKLEGVDGHEDVIQRMVQSGIPGDGPSRAAAAIGARLRRLSGSGPERRRRAARSLAQATALEELGAFAIVLECVPAALARRDHRMRLRVPTIGIGAGAGCDGQILVLQDLLGMNTDFQSEIRAALSATARACVLDALGAISTKR